MHKLPLWFVTEKEAKAGDPPPEERDTLAFSTFEKLTAFLDYDKVGVWDIIAATDREHLIVVIADVHNRGGDMVYLDPDLDGHGGEPVLLTDLMLVKE